MNLKTIALAAILALSSAAHADDSWIPFGKGRDGSTFALKKGSLDHTFITTDAGKRIRVYSAMMRFQNAQDSKITFGRPTVLVSECHEGAGTLWFYTVDRKPVIDESTGIQMRSEYVIDGGSIGSDIASAICAAGMKDDRGESKPAPAKAPTARITPV